MTAQVARLSGDEWQQWANLLLTTHYGPTEYQRVPDNQRGDAGIEGFTITEGHAFQAYGCEEPIDTKTRYERQRDKMTQDIAKFIRNKVILTNLFGTTRITRWALLVPHFDSREIVAHASVKTTEVLAANLAYVDSTFRVVVIDEEQFATEREQLVNALSDCITVEATQATPVQVTDWASEHDELTETLEAKLSRLQTLQSESERAKFRDSLLKWYIEGHDILDALRKYPTVYEKVLKAKSHQENYLAMSAATVGGSSSDILKTAIDSLLVTFQNDVKQLSSLSAQSLVHEAVADWLLRCPLDFPEVSRHA